MALKAKSYAEGLERAQRYQERQKARKPFEAGRRPNSTFRQRGVIAQNGASSKKRKGFRSVTRDKADHYFSLFVRYRDNWTCQRCGTRYEPVTASLQCSHFFGRARENTRFDPANCDSQCAGCHNFLGANPELHREWKLQKIGEEAYALLRIRAESRCKKDRKLMVMVCKQMFEKEKARFEADTQS